MVKTDLESVNNGTKRFFELFNLILEASDYKLDNLVDGNTILLNGSGLEKFSNEFQEMLDEFVSICINSKEDVVMKELKSLNSKIEIGNFIQWLSGYAESVMLPYNKTAFIRSMEIDKFINLSKYCFENYVLVESGKENIDTTLCEKTELLNLRKLIFTIADFYISLNYSKDYVYTKISSVFGLDNKYTDVLWNLIEKNEDRMWKIMFMRKLQRIEQKIDILFEE